jgi:hypothetical protein
MKLSQPALPKVLLTSLETMNSGGVANVWSFTTVYCYGSLGIGFLQSHKWMQKLYETNHNRSRHFGTFMQDISWTTEYIKQLYWASKCRTDPYQQYRNGKVTVGNKCMKITMVG